MNNPVLSQQSNEKPTILVVDDEENNLAILESYLIDAGYDVITATNGKEAWDFLKIFGENVSLILLDRMMPVMDGMEFMKLLKGHPRHYEIPIIMQTAAAMRNQVEEGIKCGVYYYLRKPFDEEMVLKLIRQALKGRRNIRVLRKRQISDDGKSEDMYYSPTLFKDI
ncbi:MAG: hypothetical protein COV36_04160 [Alphaproteobacteria bacterium CG11_big_fil_rev_8_21_14_0_20_44_7]|nr:MAG: hypothetical protein COV36_04160 [Alphaproteobacteria bacterium CG11_big_fil_rev_8_21_14_0_20_44_7]